MVKSKSNSFQRVEGEDTPPTPLFLLPFFVTFLNYYVKDPKKGSNLPTTFSTTFFAGPAFPSPRAGGKRRLPADPHRPGAVVTITGKESGYELEA